VPEKDVNQAMQDLMLDAMRRNQEAVVDMVRSWRAQVDSNAASLPQPMPGVPSVPAVRSGVTPEQVDAAFDFAQRVLADQRRFTVALLKVALPAPDSGSGTPSGSGNGAS
jgi:hypothetical protein